MTCTSLLPVDSIAADVREALADEYVRKDRPIIDNGVFTNPVLKAPSIRGDVILDSQARAAFIRATGAEYDQEIVDSAIDRLDNKIAETTELVSGAIDDVILGEYRTELEQKVDGISGDVAAQKLDTGITSTPQYVGAVARSQAQVNSDKTHVATFGATGVGDETAKIQKAIDNYDIVDFGNKSITYKVSRLTLKSKTQFVGLATLDFSDNPSYAKNMLSPLILCRGTAGTPVSITVDVTQSAFTLKVASTAGISADDIIELSTPTHSGGFSDTSTTVASAELLKVESITSSTELKLAEPVASNYGYSVANGAIIRKISTVNDIYISSGITIKGKGRPTTGEGDYGVVVIYGRDCVVSSDFIGVDYNTVKLESCYNSKVYNCNVYTDKKGTNTSLNYGVVISGSSKHTKVFSNSFTNMRHAVLTSHVSPASGDGFYGVVRGVDVFSNDFYNTWHAAVATHNDSDDFDVYKNKFYGCNVGVNPRERNMRVTQNQFYDCATGIYLSSHPKNIVIDNNTCVSQTGGTFIYGKFDADAEVSNIAITYNKMDNLKSAVGIYILNDAGVVNRGLIIKGNTSSGAVGVGGSGAIIRVNGTPIFDAEISDNTVRNYSNAIGIKVETGGDNVLIKGNHIDYGTKTAYSIAGNYTKAYAINNTAKGDAGGNIMQGSSNLTNASSVNTDNTWY